MIKDAAKTNLVEDAGVGVMTSRSERSAVKNGCLTPGDLGCSRRSRCRLRFTNASAARRAQAVTRTALCGGAAERRPFFGSAERRGALRTSQRRNLVTA